MKDTVLKYKLLKLPTCTNLHPFLFDNREKIPWRLPVVILKTKQHRKEQIYHMLGYNDLYFRNQWPTSVQRNKFLLSACFQSTEIRGKLTSETEKNLHWPESLKYQNSFLDLKKKISVNTLLKIFTNYYQCLQYKTPSTYPPCRFPSASSEAPNPRTPRTVINTQFSDWCGFTAPCFCPVPSSPPRMSFNSVWKHLLMFQNQGQASSLTTAVFPSGLHIALSLTLTGWQS